MSTNRGPVVIAYYFKTAFRFQLGYCYTCTARRLGGYRSNNIRTRHTFRNGVGTAERRGKEKRKKNNNTIELRAPAARGSPLTP